MPDAATSWATGEGHVRPITATSVSPGPRGTTASLTTLHSVYVMTTYMGPCRPVCTYIKVLNRRGQRNIMVIWISILKTQIFINIVIIVNIRET